MKVLCVGRNYAAHAKELGSAPPREPVWFLKPESAIVADGGDIVLPPGIGRVDHEVELAVRIGREARRVEAPVALRHVHSFTVAIDVTARDLQEAAKKEGLPWTRAKGFDSFLPLGEWRLPQGHDLHDMRLRLSVNGQARQDASTKDMTWKVADLVAQASRWTTLKTGDVLLTGTPPGVGPLQAGDDVVAEVVGEAKLTCAVVAGKP